MINVAVGKELNSRKVWSDAELANLADLWCAGTPIPVLEQHFKRSWSAIRTRLYKLEVDYGDAGYKTKAARVSRIGEPWTDNQNEEKSLCRMMSGVHPTTAKPVPRKSPEKIALFLARSVEEVYDRIFDIMHKHPPMPGTEITIYETWYAEEVQKRQKEEKAEKA